MKIHVGQSGRKKLTLPAEFVTETAAILARRGGGKTYTGNVFAEGLLECGHQVVVIDPLNAWWGLRSSANGKKPGYNIVIFGGSRGDLPLDKHMGAGIADLVAEDPTFSCVLSLRHLSKGAQKKFVLDFAARLFHRKGDEKLATAVHIFLDEADIFCPQQVQAREAEMVGAIDDLVRRGRQAGIGVTMITQRSAALNKNILSQAELLIAGQITGAHDKKAVLDWIKDNADMTKQKEFMASLAQLQIGQFWFWSPRWLEMLALVHIRKRNTFDSSATPKPGKRRRVPKRVRKVDLAAIKKTLMSAIKSAESTDPKALRRQVAELEEELRKKVVTKLAAVPIIQGIPEVQVAIMIKEAVDARDDVWHGMMDAELEKFKDGITIPLWNPKPILVPASAFIHDSHFRKVASTPKQPSNVQELPRLPASRQIAIPTLEGQLIPKCQQAILQVLASRSQDVSTKLIALQSGYSIKSSGFKNALSWLRTKGFITGNKEAIQLTLEGSHAFVATGLAVAGIRDPEYWLGKLPKCERAIFQVLLQRNRQGLAALSKEEIAAGAGYSMTSSGFKNALSKLRGLALIMGTSSITLADELFQ